MRGKKRVDFFWLFLIFFFLFLSYLNFSLFKKGREIKEKAEFLKAQIREAEKKKEKLKEKISETEKESFWEEKAREQGYIREGEEPFIIKFK